ncbi:MAG: cell division protein FtsB [Gammaproteobacteria bacterium]|nr:cell division protein FtsB [Gammaproteobacteria bacterium]
MLVLLFVALFYRLLFGDGSVQEVWQLHQQAEQQRALIEKLRERNQILEAEVLDLKKGLDAIEERARSELGMIRDGEKFYQFIDRERSPDADVPALDEQLTPPGQVPVR